MLDFTWAMSRIRVLPRVAALFVVLSSAAAAALGSTDAHASVSIAVSWEGLLHESTAAALITAEESRSVWENNRIYTYTRVHVDRAISGELATGSEPWVRTMGGVVGKIGQLVEGEPVFTIGESSLLFLHAGPVGAFEVTARAQGQFPLDATDPKLPARVVRSRAMGALLPRATSAPAALPRLAADVLHGRLVDDAVQEIAAAWGRTHAR